MSTVICDEIRIISFENIDIWA